MKSEWEFFFETRDFVFEREHVYTGHPNEPIQIGSEVFDDLVIEVKLVPSMEPPERPSAEQTGSLFVTLPGTPDESRDLACFVAQSMSERISFASGDFRLHYGVLKCTRIAETPEEEREIEDSQIWLQVSLQEVIDSPTFDSSGFQALAHASLPLLAQFNEAKRHESSIARFLGFFRIIESWSYGRRDRGSMQQALLGNTEMRERFVELLPDGDFEEFVTALVHARHACAHLKIEEGFGYAPTNPEIRNEVEPLLPVVEALARQYLAGRPDD